VKAKPYSDQKNWSNTYLTDPAVVKALGPFDTDPCCPPKMPWRTARAMLSHEKIRSKVGAQGYMPGLREEDGLTAEWRGRVFMNPPYRGVTSWAKKFAEHRNGIALLNGRSTETKATQIIMESSRAILFPSGRLEFFRTNGKPWGGKWFPSLLIAMTFADVAALRRLQRVTGGQIFIKENAR
jgi:hypothetical protein